MDRSSPSSIENAAPPESRDDELSAAETRALHRLRQQVNKLVAESHQRMDEMADKLFAGLTDGVPATALDPTRRPSAAFRAMLAMCGDTLLLDKATLSRAVRIGALNARYPARTAWHRLDWTMKAALLPLLGSEVSYTRLEAGIAVAAKGKATTRSVTAWVTEQLSEAGKASTRTRALSAVTTRRFFEVGRQLRQARTRHQFAARLRKLERAAFDSALSEIQATIKNLQQLHDELKQAA